MSPDGLVPVGPEAIVWAGASALLIVIGLVRVIRRTGLIGERWSGLLAVGLGLGLGLLAGDLTGAELATSIIQGVMVGLAATGAWATAETARNG